MENLKARLPTCGTCKHWGDKKDKDETFKRCLAVIHDSKGITGTYNEDVLDWEWLDEEEKAEIQAVRKHLAVVKDGSGYFAALKVREDFGCVLHENKDTVK